MADANQERRRALRLSLPVLAGYVVLGIAFGATLALLRENPDQDESEIREYLAGNLCRCSGYEGQLRAIQSFLAWKRGKEAGE